MAYVLEISFELSRQEGSMSMKMPWSICPVKTCGCIFEAMLNDSVV
jgi:hypothetical protein